ncbi:MAG: 23S rRNA (guanosine(2251)-2'-O)-methyltransferase RlmB [Bacteroidales bacterium]
MREGRKEKHSFIYGFHSVLEAMDSGKTFDKILFRKGIKSEVFSDVFQRIRELGIPYQFVPSQKLDGITRKNHQGIIAFVSPIEIQFIEDILPGLFEQGKTPFLLLLDKVTDVRNFGAITRTAECAGVDAILVPAKHSAGINQDAVKTSAGALLRVPVCRRESMTEAAEYIKNSGVQLVATTEHSDKNYYDVDYNKPTALIMGAEDTGISDKILHLADHNVKIPMAGEIESLNVSVAAGIMMFEVVKQRR